MNQFLRKNFALILAFLLPTILIATVGLSAYLPSRLLTTNYNFVYASCADGDRYYPYRCDEYIKRHYSVVDNKITVNVVDDIALDTNKNGTVDPHETYTDRLFLHDTEKNESREITLEEAKEMKLNGLLTSPDGLTVSRDYNSSGGGAFFIFGGDVSSYGHYLTKGKARTKLNLINDGERYYSPNTIQFIGWVLPGR